MILTPFLLPLLGSSAPPAEPSGRYVEARTASVFAGACHYGGERTTAGREALLAWSIDAGTLQGVDLAGLSVAAAIVDDGNLADPAAARRSVVYVPETATPAQRDALAAWVGSRAHDLLGEVIAVQVVPLQVRIADESYSAVATGVFRLSGDALPDRACCKMPLDVWYDPLVALASKLVGRDGEFDFREPLLDRTWSRPGENAAFFGRFGE
jgi:hypothetical protein